MCHEGARIAAQHDERLHLDKTTLNEPQGIPIGERRRAIHRCRAARNDAAHPANSSFVSASI